MINYLLRRVVYGILILLGVNLITFVLFFAVNTPDDMARLNLGGRRVMPLRLGKRRAVSTNRSSSTQRPRVCKK